MAADSRVTAEQLEQSRQEYINRMLQQAQRLATANPPVYPEERAVPPTRFPEFVQARQLANRTGLAEPALREAQTLLQSSQSFPEARKQYESPYLQSVVDQIGKEGVKRRDAAIQGMNTKYAGLGQIGGKQNMRSNNELFRGAEEAIAAQQAKALMAGYQQSAQMHAADEARKLEQANALAKLGLMGQGARDSDIGQLLNQGNFYRQYEQMQKDMALQDFYRQQEDPWTKLMRQHSVLSGMPAPMTQTSHTIHPMEPQLNMAGSIGQMGFGLAGLFGRKARGGSVDMSPAMRHALLSRGDD